MDESKSEAQIEMQQVASKEVVLTRKIRAKVKRRVKRRKLEKSASMDKLIGSPAATNEFPESAPERHEARHVEKESGVAVTQQTASPELSPKSGKSLVEEPEEQTSCFPGSLNILSASQSEEFRRAFVFIDHDKDGIISREDIRKIYASLNLFCPESELHEMTRDFCGPINLEALRFVLEQKLQNFDEEDVIFQALSTFDEGDGSFNVRKLRHALMSWGEKMTKNECDEILTRPLMDCRGHINIKRFASLLTLGKSKRE